MKLLIDFLLVAGLLANGVILFLLLRQSHQPLPKRILNFIFVGLFFVSLNAYGELHDLVWIFLVGFLLSDPIGYLIGPLLLFYINAIYLVGFRLKGTTLLHLAPFILYFLGVTLPFVICQLGGLSLPSYLNTLLDSDFFLQFQALYLLLYCGLSWQAINYFRKKLKGAYADLEAKDLGWIRRLLLGIIITISVHLGLTLYELTTATLNWSFSYLSTIILVLFIIYLAYYGLEQSRILLPPHLLEDSSAAVPQVEHVPSSSDPLQHFNPKELEYMHQRVTILLEEEEIYLNEELTLGILAEQIPTTDKKLSALLNHYMNTNFYDLINSYRITAVKNKLSATEFEHLTILAIAFDSGFKSKTSFNRIFKKETGLSPSAYKKKATK